MNVQQALEGGQDDVVTVNQRALIDKILARYPGEFTGESRVLQMLDIHLIFACFSVSGITSGYCSACTDIAPAELLA